MFVYLNFIKSLIIKQESIKSDFYKSKNICIYNYLMKCNMQQHAKEIRGITIKDNRL